MSFQLSQLLVGIISKLPAIRGPSWLCLAPSTLSLRQTGATHWEKPTLTQVIPLTNNFLEIIYLRDKITYSNNLAIDDDDK